MAKLKKRSIIDGNKLSGEFYFNSILREAYNGGLLNAYDLEQIQLQCISLLADKCGRYNMGASSSIRVELAERIMQSNLYSIGLYLKSLPDPDQAAAELKTVKIAELYERGKKLVHTRFQAAKWIYNMVQKNKLDTLNHSYNSTLSENGIGIFFKAYNREYEAHDFPASIDYQLCHPVDDLAGVEFIQKYLERLYLENEFCLNFAAENIHHLLYGYDKGYADLLINIFEHVLTAALGCALANRNIRELRITPEDLQSLYIKLLSYDHDTLMSILQKAMEDMFEELKITNLSLQSYVERSLPKIAPVIENALKLNTLNKVFITPVTPDLEPKIQFESGVKMEDEEYRKLIEELLSCRYSSDKLELIKEKVKSFDDLEDVLLDGQLKEEEFISLLNTLGDIEIAAMIKRHPFHSPIQAVDLSEGEQVVRLYLEKYVNQLPRERQEQIFQMVKQLLL
ncbi:MAG: hypothetical protein GX081_12245 [Firmicutes bacterium]|nr:hypothetical protein [Bacillota bacterium]